eukprot:NODE_1_length_6681_cov_34.557901_g0_i0.p15 GENE.NODE_1_length_6681_cov_34.557901_g0_i0~~NODE_1_length_6681_cov_34.557901_g0_i0.p15  ORF type:complete len:78 (-),score=3.57 NODE_1_length_6681_cov_34.557901_g0_i0:2025-2258(-)
MKLSKYQKVNLAETKKVYQGRMRETYNKIKAANWIAECDDLLAAYESDREVYHACEVEQTRRERRALKKLMQTERPQ